MDSWISDRLDNFNVFDWEAEQRNLENPNLYLIFYLCWSDPIDFGPKLQ